jgi:hypothetical protein
MPDEMHEHVEDLRFDMRLRARAAKLATIAIDLGVFEDEVHGVLGKPSEFPQDA